MSHRVHKIKRNKPVFIVWDIQDQVMCGIYKNKEDALERAEHLVAKGFGAWDQYRVTEHTVQ